MTSQIFHSPGKLLLTAEYVVLDGAKALAIPTRYGQLIQVIPTGSGTIEWLSTDESGNPWFEESFDIKSLQYSGSGNETSNRLQEILRTAQKLNPDFLSESNGFQVNTQLDFPRNWGLGTSSTLLNNIALWAQVNAHELLTQSFGGSGYDVAVAKHKSPILYELENGQPKSQAVALTWEFTEQLFFVHLNQKQDSKEGIERYLKAKEATQIDIDQFSRITSELLECKSLSNFIERITLHEAAISSIIDLPTVKESLFPEYHGAIKSLGAWGGDFVMVTVMQKDDLNYFKDRGYTTIIPFSNMIA